MGLSIGDVSRRVGISASAIRYYEQVGLIAEPARKSGRRDFDIAVLGKLNLIRSMRNAGLGITEIRRLLDRFDGSGTPGKDWQLYAQDWIARIDTTIAHSQQLRARLLDSLECECDDLHECRIVAEC